MKKLQDINQITLINCVKKSLENSRELFEEAEILKINKRYPRAYTLYHLSIEEIGKTFIIFKYLIQNNYSEENSKKFNREFMDHKTKIKTSKNIEKMMFILMRDELDTKKFEPLLYSIEAIDILNKYKNLSLYSFIENKSVFKPSEIIGLEEVNLIRPNAETRLILSEQFFRLAINDINKFISFAKNE